MGNGTAVTGIDGPDEGNGQIQSASTSGYIRGFDGLRAIAVSTVLVAHAGYGYLFPGGFGVTIFFAISGYLITSLLLVEYGKTGTINLKMFYARRLIRLYPELMALIFFCSIAGLALNLRATIAEWFAGPLYYMNYYYVFGAHYPVAQCYNWRQLWSLSVEEHFYIFFPGALLFLARTTKERLWFIGALVVAPAIWRLATHFLLDLPWQYNYVATDTRIDSIAWGCLLAVLLRTEKGEQRDVRSLWFINLPMVFAGTALILASLLYRDESFRWTWRFSLQGLGLFLLIGNILFDTRWRMIVAFLELGPVRFIGRISYGMYLYHMLINRVMNEYLDGVPLPMFLSISLVLTVLAASLSYALLEKPLKKFRRRLGSHVR